MKQLVDQKYVLQKMPGKGGWTYIVITEIPKEKRAQFGMLKVSGKIDSYELKDINLMPMKNGHLFLPVKAEIRKVIGKQEGDWAQVILFAEEVIEDEQLDDKEALLLCLGDEPKALETFLSYTETEQQAFINWIAETKNDKVKVNRIAKSIDLLLNKQKLKI